MTTKNSSDDKLIDETMGTVAVLLPESDRGAVLVAAAFVDAQLEALLAARLVQSIDPAEDLKDERLKQYPKSVFADARLLQSTSSKEMIAFMCGLISQQEFRECKMIRDIRNSFAHSIFTASFDIQSVRDRCESLRKSRADNVDLDGDPIDARTMFLWAATRLAVTFAARAQEIEPLPRLEHVEPWDPQQLREHVIKTLAQFGGGNLDHVKLVEAVKAQFRTQHGDDVVPNETDD